MTNANGFRLFLCVIFVCLIGSGCTSDEPAKKHTEVTKNVEPKDKLPSKGKEEMPDEGGDQSNMMVIEEAPKDSKSPAEAATYQYKLIMANGEENFMTQSAVVNEVVLGDRGLVLLDTRKFNDNFILMVYEKSDRWETSSVLEIDYQNGEQYEEAKELSLPFDSFVVVNQPKSNPAIWTFSNGKEVVTIAEYKDYEFDKGKNISMETSPGGKQLFVSKEPDNHYLYYGGSGYTVVISGTIKIDEMKQLADSMDSVQLPNFPVVSNL